MTSTQAMELSNLKVIAATHSCIELDRFDANPGECIALLGPNGSGKSSFLRAISGHGSLQRELQISGTVRISGKFPLQVAESARAELIGYFRDSLETEFPISVREVLGISRSFKSDLVGAVPTAQIIADTGLEPLLSLSVSSLSGGERQRVLLAMALIQNPKVMALDETLSQLDLNHLWKMGSLLRRFAQSQKSVILLVTHEWNFASQWADRIVLVQQGKCLSDGKPEQVITQENLRTLYPEWAATVTPGRRPQLVFPAI